MSMKEKLKTETIDGHKFDIFIGEDGRFFVEWDHGTTAAETMKALLEKLRGQVRLNRAKIEATLLDESRWSRGADSFLLEDIIVTGKHASHGNILYRTVKDGKAGSESSYSQDILVRLSEKQKAEMVGLWKAEHAAHDAYQKFKTDHRLDVTKALAEAAFRGEGKGKADGPQG